MLEARYRAAGGVVLDDDGHVLVLHRPSRGELRLPKGHVEPGETDRDAAVREVGEESGYVDVAVVRDLGVQRVEFDTTGDERMHVVRDEHYFAMRLLSDRRARRTPADEKFEPDFVPVHEALVSLTFDVEREWVRRALREDPA